MVSVRQPKLGSTKLDPAGAPLGVRQAERGSQALAHRAVISAPGCAPNPVTLGSAPRSAAPAGPSIEAHSGRGTAGWSGRACGTIHPGTVRSWCTSAWNRKYAAGGRSIIVPACPVAHRLRCIRGRHSDVIHRPVQLGPCQLHDGQFCRPAKRTATTSPGLRCGECRRCK